MKSYKGKKVHFKKFKNEYELNDYEKTIFEYEGYCNEEENPHGTGKLAESIIVIETGKMTDRRDEAWVRDGEWINGVFIKGTYSTPFKQKYIGFFAVGSDGDSELTGDGVEYYYQSKKDYINDKNSGYVKGFFDLGKLIKGEILNPSLTGYSEHKGINKIILEGKIRSIYVETIKGKINLNKGEIFYENGDHYKGEIYFDLPFGKGTMTLKDGSQKTCEWHNGNVKEN